MPVRLPVLPASADPLDRVEIATPCSVPWETLSGTDRVRHCGRCDQNVYNVAALSRVEALALITDHEGRACLRLMRRADGTLITADCWARLRAARKRGLLTFAVMLVIVAGVQLPAMVLGLGRLLGLAPWNREESRPSLGARPEERLHWMGLGVLRRGPSVRESESDGASDGQAVSSPQVLPYYGDLNARPNPTPKPRAHRAARKKDDIEYGVVGRARMR